MIACMMSFGSDAVYDSTPQPVYISNYSSFCATIARDDEEEQKRRHAEECRKRNLGYLWRPFIFLHRLRFKVLAPFLRFIPCWSARRWRSRT